MEHTTHHTANLNSNSVACSSHHHHIIIKFFNKKLSNATSHNGEENGVQIIINNNVYTKLLSRNVVNICLVAITANLETIRMYCTVM